MRPYLLDVNILIALAWPNYAHRIAALVKQCPERLEIVSEVS